MILTKTTSIGGEKTTTVAKVLCILCTELKVRIHMLKINIGI